MGDLLGFAKERVGSLVSKKVAGGATSVVLATGGSTEGAMYALGYTALQTLYDAWTYYCDTVVANKE
jgi:hypothetical protein